MRCDFLGAEAGASDSARLRLLLLVLAGASGAFAAVEGGIFAATGRIAEGLSALALASALLPAAAAFRRAQKGETTHAVVLTVTACVVLGVFLALTPPVVPGVALLPLLGVAVGLPFLTGRPLRRLIIICWLATSGIAVLLEFVPDTQTPLPWVDAIVRVATLSTVVGISLLASWQYSSRLVVALLQTRLASDALGRSEARYRTLVDNVSEVIFQTDPTGRWVYLNQAWELLTGRLVSETLDRPLIESVHPEDAPRVRDLLEPVLSGRVERCRNEFRVAADGGELRTIELEARAMSGEAGVLGLTGILRDVTEQRRLERRLEHRLRERTVHDPLTGLANRAHLSDRLAHALAHLEQRDASEGGVAVLLLDLDGFRTFNDTLGHAAGDELLVAVSHRLQGCLRGDMVARVGGDEFAVLLEGRDAADAAGVAERVSVILREPYAFGEQTIYLPASVGVALAPAAGGGAGELAGARPDADTLLGDAEVAMYHAKAARGGGFAIFQPAMHAAVFARVELERELRVALARGDFRLVYQPVVDIGSRRTVGVEALLRWVHPERGVLMPDTFISLAEETGLIIPLGGWVLEEACRQAAAWSREPGLGDLWVAVNIAAIQITEPHFAETVKATLAGSGLQPRQLVLEVTEGTMAEGEALVNTLASLRAHGARLALDDFGTGYSSLAALRRLPVDIIKVDRRFVTELTNGPDEVAVVRAILQLAGTLGFEVIAEGVETAGQAAALRSLGCRLVQGYYFARPTDPETLTPLLLRRLGAPPRNGPDGRRNLSSPARQPGVQITEVAPPPSPVG